LLVEWYTMPMKIVVSNAKSAQRQVHGIGIGIGMTGLFIIIYYYNLLIQCIYVFCFYTSTIRF
jgi:hypothetical protein